MLTLPTLMNLVIFPPETFHYFWDRMRFVSLLSQVCVVGFRKLKIFSWHWKGSLILNGLNQNKGFLILLISLFLCCKLLLFSLRSWSCLYLFIFLTTFKIKPCFYVVCENAKIKNLNFYWKDAVHSLKDPRGSWSLFVLLSY